MNGTPPNLPAFRPTPPWGPGLLDAIGKATGSAPHPGAWILSGEGFYLGLGVLIAVLRQAPGPATRADIEYVTVFVLRPELIAKHLDRRQQSRWRAATTMRGQPKRSIESLDIGWYRVLNNALICGIAQADEHDIWRGGPKLETDSGMLDPRALAGWALLRRLRQDPRSTFHVVGSNHE